jgi:hypothetical protein
MNILFLRKYYECQRRESLSMIRWVIERSQALPYSIKERQILVIAISMVSIYKQLAEV